MVSSKEIEEFTYSELHPLLLIAFIQRMRILKITRGEKTKDYRLHFAYILY